MQTDPGWEAADKCIAEVEAAESDRRWLGPVLRVAHAPDMKGTDEQESGSEISEFSRRAAQMTAGFQTTVKTTFVYPGAGHHNSKPGLTEP